MDAALWRDAKNNRSAPDQHDRVWSQHLQTDSLCAQGSPAALSIQRCLFWSCWTRTVWTLLAHETLCWEQLSFHRESFSLCFPTRTFLLFCFLFLTTKVALEPLISPSKFFFFFLRSRYAIFNSPLLESSSLAKDFWLFVRKQKSLPSMGAHLLDTLEPFLVPSVSFYAGQLLLSLLPPSSAPQKAWSFLTVP